jgi:hypothetical protein
MLNPDDILTGNSLFMVFLGWEKKLDDKFMFPKFFPETTAKGYELKGAEDAKFHKSFDWLVWVIRKALVLKMAHKLNKVLRAWYELDIERAWLEMVEVVEWYNEGKNNSDDCRYYVG